MLESLTRLVCVLKSVIKKIVLLLKKKKKLFGVFKIKNLFKICNSKIKNYKKNCEKKETPYIYINPFNSTGNHPDKELLLRSSFTNRERLPNSPGIKEIVLKK